jgi:hypothetical protein
VSPLAERSRARSQLWRLTRNRTHLYRAIVSIKNDDGGRQFVRRSSKIVIDGFERSGNTFAYQAFVDANGAAFHIGHHTHSPAQLRWAARWGIPTILLVRPAAALVLSVTLRWPARRPHEVVEDYLRFHARALELRDHFLVGTFERVTTDYGAVIADVNARFGTGFEPFESTERSRDRVFSAIEARNAHRYGRVTEVAVARPSEARRAATDERGAVLDRPGIRRLLDEAEALRAEIESGGP